MGKKCKKLRDIFSKNEKDKKNDNNKKDKKDKKDKKEKPVSKKLKDNNIRKICQYLGPFVKDSIIGSYYYYIHLFIMTMCGLVIFFSKNIHYLTILLIIVTLDLFLIVI